MNLQTDIVEYLKGERRPMKRQELCVSIVKEASHNHAWPKATHEEWMLAINAAVRDGALVLVNESVWLATKPVEPVDRQLDLF
jgi:hypothetical protein